MVPEIPAASAVHRFADEAWDEFLAHQPVWATVHRRCRRTTADSEVARWRSPCVRTAWLAAVKLSRSACSVFQFSGVA